MPRHSQQTLNKIRDLDILAVADHLNMRYSQNGRFRMCRCFLHDDRHPSMWLKLSNNTWSCPVCNKGGGVASLVMEHEKLSFPEAIDWLIREFGIWEPDEPLPYRPRPSRPNPPITSPSMNHFLSPSYVERSSGTTSVFCRSLVANGILSAVQMRHAAETYRLGATRDGGVIFWYINPSGQVHEGKIMWYLPDSHRNRQHTPSTVSSRLIIRGELSRSWKATPSLYGLHLLVPGATVAVVESEKTAILCSELLPQTGESPIVWTATGGLSNLQSERLSPLQGHKVILFPDTDPTGDTYRQWSRKAEEIAQELGQPIYVSPLLEQLATEEQKQRKIDIADLITNA